MGRLNLDSPQLRTGSDLTNPALFLKNNKIEEAGNLLQIDVPNTTIKLGSLDIVKSSVDVTLATDGATTSTGITPTGTVLAISASVITAIAGLDSADHHYQIGVSGTTDKYIDKANGSASTSIAVNTKDQYFLDTAKAVDGGELIITLTGGSDVTPTGGVVRIEIYYLNVNALADV